MSDFENLFSWKKKNAPATDRDIRFLQNETLKPITDQETLEANKAHWDIIKNSKQSFDSSRWKIPEGTFPEAYLSFLRWSKGGSFRNGERQFDPFFIPEEIREMILSYEFPEYMEGAIPFAFDGGGVFFVFDMRHPPKDGDYPIYVAGSGALFWDSAVWVCNSFTELIEGTTDPYDSG